MSSTSLLTRKVGKVAKPYNNYNIFFILERELLIQARGKHPSPASSSTAFNFNGYDNIDLPAFPPRYAHLDGMLNPNWFVSGKKHLAKPKHIKSHGVATFKEIPKIVADNWKVVDPITKDYNETVAALLKKRWTQIPAERKQMPKKKVGRPSKMPLTPQQIEERRQAALKVAEQTPHGTSLSTAAAAAALSMPIKSEVCHTPKKAETKQNGFMEDCFPNIPIVSPARSAKKSSECFDDDCSIDSFRCNLESIEYDDFSHPHIEEEFLEPSHSDPIQVIPTASDASEYISSTKAAHQPTNDIKHPLHDEYAKNVAGELSEYCEADVSDYSILQFHFNRD